MIIENVSKSFVVRSLITFRGSFTSTLVTRNTSGSFTRGLTLSALFLEGGTVKQVSLMWTTTYPYWVIFMLLDCSATTCPGLPALF